ncbi:MAG: hypothetical protein LQ352_007371 [Teloschistes flavicans]|nr:MAG: hypothetical protein LQ352_007371 [Teloschistes flavicans]
MKILTKEEEQEHYRYLQYQLSALVRSLISYRETLKGGFGGGFAGLGLGVAGVFLASKRFPAFRQLTLPLRAFLVTSSGTFGAIISADHFSRAYEKSRHPENQFEDSAAKARAQSLGQQSSYERFMTFGKENRYQIVGGSWVASMAIALSIVGRSPYLSTAQKLVQARVYAQALTIGVLVATAAFEIGDRSKEEGRWETVKYVDPDDPEHKRMVEKKVHHESYRGEDQWRDMVEAEEQKEKARLDAIHEQEEKDRKAGKIHHKKKQQHHDDDSTSNNDDKKKSSEGKDGGASEMEKEGKK